ncbi:glycosyl transferase [Sphingobium boeckii]|uniref:Glycosyl transferase n=1 Tax=Sphingobium boeckii TaxID=1082345 RepID=A0A7W9AI89_9SPHN|nr:glycosyl transferase [Sphingobium boeckii]MBB5686185.1 hypothetical protein [Sphingobium boeckii]
MTRGQQSQSADIGFLFVGGIHQMLHIAPLALALARRPDVAITAYVSVGDAKALAAMFAQLDAETAPRIPVVPMVLPRWAKALRRLLGGNRGAKPIELLTTRRKLLTHDALFAAERTSTLLKRLPGRRPVMIHFPHGAGDRAKGFDPRIALFDHVLVAGPLIYQRTLAQGLATAENCTIAGSIKLAVLTGPDAPPPANPFADDKPIVLFNPHFDTRLSSWSMAEALIDRIAVDGRFNLIIAPHARLYDRMDAAERARWRNRPAAPNIVFDFDSSKLGDMTYTRLADIYLGDVSSQVYEFLHRPRPCLFADAHGVNWRGNPDYQMWTLGDVCTTPDQIVDAIAHADERHARYRALQQAETEGKLGPIDAGVPDRAADQVLAALARIRAKASA